MIIAKIIDGVAKLIKKHGISQIMCIGGGYLAHGMYRPQQHCMMRDYAPFCVVCNRAIEAVIEAHSDQLVSVKSEHRQSETSLRVRPNPATDFIDVFVDQKDGQAEIVDITGKTVMTVQLGNFSFYL